MTPHLDRHSKTEPTPEMLTAKPEIEFAEIKEMYALLGMHTCSEKTTF